MRRAWRLHERSRRDVLGLYPWFEERGTRLVHPDDLEAFRQLFPHGKVFQRVAADGAYVILAYGSMRYRVNPDLFQPVPIIAFPIGTPVVVISNNADAVIEAIRWHHRDAKPFYLIRRTGKKSTRRYWEEELRPAAPIS